MFFAVVRYCFFCLEERGKTSQTYFGDSGVKGSGKVVGLAAEHKGAWVIIDLRMTLHGRREKVHILQQVNLKLAQQMHI